MAYINGEIRPIFQQGRTEKLHGIIIYTPENGNCASITGLNFNNGGAPFSFSLYRKTHITGKEILLYSFELSAGDIVIDTVGYHLSSLIKKGDGDYLWLVPRSGHVNYTIEGLEYEKGTIVPPFGRGGSVSVIDQYGQPKAKCCSEGSGYVYDCLSGTTTEETNTFQSNDLIGGKDLKFLIIDKQVFTEINEDYTVDYDTGIITTITVVMYDGSKIVGPYNRKV